MKKKFNRIKRQRIILIGVLLTGLVTLDFIFTSTSMEPGTFKAESDFDVISGATTKVGVVPSDYSELSNPVSRTVNPTYDQIEEMVRKAIELQGGLDWIVSKGDNVLIKVNLVGADSPSGQGENTDVRVVKALIKIIDELTEGDVEIVVAEGTARTNDDPTKDNSVWDNSGYRDLLTDPYLEGIDLSLLNLNQSLGDMVEVDLGSKGTSAKQGTLYHVHKAQLEADVYIAVPVLKIHDTGITNVLKLQVGTAPGCWYGYNKATGTTHSPGIYHDVDQRIWTTEAIVDLSTIADIDFVVVDAIMCLDSYKTYRGDNQVRMNTIIASNDPVAVDHVAARLFCLNPDDIAHITLAEKIGLGTNDPDKIHVKGATIEEVRKKVQQNLAEDGLFGQSNRTWLLSQAFEGTSVETDYIENEAELEPVAGENGWSESVYFFDDRIDLLSYYGGESDIVSYAFSYFYSPEAKTAELWLGTHEGIEVFINGDMVYHYYSLNSSFNDSERGGRVKDINILQGENRLLVKTLNRYGDYSFTLNICDKESSTIQNGNRVAGLKFYTKSAYVGNREKIDDTSGEVLSAYPNPASKLVTILMKAEVAPGTPATVNIYSVNGQLIRSLFNQDIHSTPCRIEWNLENEYGVRVPAGVYLCVARFGNQTETIRIAVE
ncbi:MAG: DUF362 domain-containing protein [Bacteroidales bacterium]|nr:DUF362 domain-containing protein [Bacteroidales bacterium]